MDLLNIGIGRRWRWKKAKRKEDEDGEEEGRAMVDPKDPTKGDGDGVVVQNGEGGEKDYGDDDDDDDEDDFLTEEVKRRLKELRKNHFMVLIPEEECLKDEDGEEGSSSSEWREEREEEGEEVDEECRWCGFDAFYGDYSQRMAFFDKMAKQLLESPESRNQSIRLPKSVSKKVALAIRNLSFKRKDEHKADVQHLELEHVDNPCENLETVYVAQICLSWEALHIQFKQLSQKISSGFETSCCYSYACQAFQQFQVLLQRFIENEPFEDGSRFDSYARARKNLPLFLQIPRYQDLEIKGDEDSQSQPIPATDLLKIMKDSIVTFHHFLKLEKNSRSLHMFGGHNQTGHMLQLLHNSLCKKEAKLKEIYKKKRTRQKESSPRMGEEIDLLLALIDIKIVARVLKLDKISQQQLLWCEEKMSKLDISDSHLRRNASPVIFPC